MTTRYRTPGEIAGVKRRVATYAARQRAAGRRARKLWATDAEIAQIRALLAVWRGEQTDLPHDLRAAAMALEPRPTE